MTSGLNQQEGVVLFLAQVVAILFLAQVVAVPQVATSGCLTGWMKVTSGYNGGSPINSTVRCVALGSGWKYGENFPKSQKRQD